MQTIKDAEIEIRYLKKRVDKLEKKGGLAKFFRYDGLVTDLNHQEMMQRKRIDPYLRDNHPDYQRPVMLSYDLLETSNIYFTVYAETFTPYGNRVDKLSGNIYPNGYSYCDATESNVNFNSFTYGSFPSALEGSVDYWGRVDLEVTKVGIDLRSSFPSTFKGTVSKHGSISLEVDETKFEFEEKMMVSKMIANHFEYDEDKCYSFHQNINELRLMIDQFRESIEV